MGSPEKKNIENFELVYKTSITPFFPICLLGRHYSRKLKSIFGLDNQPQEVIVVITAGTVNWFFSKTLKPIAIELIDKTMASPIILARMMKAEKRLSKNLLAAIKTPLTRLRRSNVVNPEGLKKLKRILKIYESYGYAIDVVGFLLQVYALDYFKEKISAELKGAGLSKLASDETLDLLLGSADYTNYEKFISSLLKVKRHRSLLPLVDSWFWLVHDYVGEIIDEKYLLNKINHLNRVEATQDLKRAAVRVKVIKEKLRLLPPAVRQKVKIIQRCLWLYNEKKKQVLNRVNIYLRRQFEAKYPALTFAQLRNLYQYDPDTIIKIFSSSRLLSAWLKRKRFVYTIKNGRISTGSAAYFSFVKNRILGAKEVLRGNPACRGKVRGPVSLILNISQITKFTPGNILVAPFTNVNYLPIMSKARAILTETGGLTSHAAIVSRELKKPCIVGIPHLLANLYEGQEVEVDADKGTVKIIK